MLSMWWHGVSKKLVTIEKCDKILASMSRGPITKKGVSPG